MTRPANIAAWLATEQPHIDLAYVGKDTTIADAKAEILRLDAELARLGDDVNWLANRLAAEIGECLP